MRTLLTKDGRQIGNAIIIKEVGTNDKGVPLFEIETDYGNRIPRINKNEIEAWFYPGQETTYERWSADRSNLQNRTLDDGERDDEPYSDETG